MDIYLLKYKPSSSILKNLIKKDIREIDKTGKQVTSRNKQLSSTVLQTVILYLFHGNITSIIRRYHQVFSQLERAFFLILRGSVFKALSEREFGESCYWWIKRH